MHAAVSVRDLMESIIIHGGKPLTGSVETSGAKNAALPLLAAAILADGPVIYSGIPHLKDITTMMTLIAHQGAEVTFDDQSRLHIDSRTADRPIAPYDVGAIVNPLWTCQGKPSWWLCDWCKAY